MASAPGENKITFSISLVTDNDEVTQRADCPIIVYNNQPFIAVPAQFLMEYIELLKRREIGLVISNRHIEKKPEAENAVEWVDFIYLKEGTKTVKAFFKNIKYIFSDDDYTYICTIDNQQLISKNSLEWFEQKCPPECFMKIHGSYLINMIFIIHYINNGRTGFVIMIDGKDLNVSQRSKKEFEEKSKPFLFSLFK